jgi:hypothetical protein
MISDDAVIDNPDGVRQRIVSPSAADGYAAGLVVLVPVLVILGSHARDG